MSLINVNVNADCINALRAEIKQQHAYVIYKFTNDFSEVVLDQIGSPNATVSDLVASLPENECRFATIEVNFEMEGKRSKTVLVLWCPMRASVKARLISASASKAFKTVVGNYGVSLTQQCGNKVELTEEALLERCKKFAA